MSEEEVKLLVHKRGACAENQRDAQERKYEEFEVLYNATCLVIESLKDALSTSQIISVAQPEAAQQSQVIVQQQSLRAPLPTFDGKYEHWPRFKAMFQDLMSRSSDCDAIKLYHLEKSLVGDAAGIIDSQTIQDNNYAQAWTILEQRFENKRLIVDLHIRGLLNLKRKTKKSSKELRLLLDECCRHVENLKFLGQELLGVSELFVVNVLTAALDKETREHWESTLDHGVLSMYSVTLKPSPNFQKPYGQKLTNSVTSPSSATCELCSGQHPNFKCSVFRSMTVSQRIAKVKECRLCFNCLRKGHRSNMCASEKTCTKCSQKHHSLLHQEYPDVATIIPEKQEVEATSQAVVNATKTPAEISSEESVSNALVSHVSTQKPRFPLKEVLLLTAVVSLIDDSGRHHSCRALLDCASQVCLISSDMVRKLRKQPWSTNTEDVGITCKKKVRQGIIVTVASNHSEYKVDIPCLVMPQVSGIIPTRKIKMSKWHLPVNISLADPEFHSPKQVDLLIGNKFFFSLLKSGQIKISDDMPLLQETIFGLVVAESVDVPQQNVVLSNVVTENIDKMIQKFWEVEEVPDAPSTTTEEQLIEDHFMNTHRRDDTGRFVVRLPFHESVTKLGDNRALALKRFLLLEQRLQRRPELKQQYEAFIDEYEALGHCCEVNEAADLADVKRYYLPHHAVFKLTSSSTKVRVLFDATARSFGLSLNDVLQVGPTIQNDLLTILLLFRWPQFAFTADITKMYRQVWVDDCDTSFQRIFWRKTPTVPIRVLELKTVTYGTASAPFLAIRSLLQLAKDEQADFPEAAVVVCDHFYIDNVLTGADTETDAIRLRDDSRRPFASCYQAVCPVADIEVV
ncbi:uncharacterized protein LOC129728654 [Wyeomyia smithii]|uniref:uncharacterized protein LOC129728654 n=1 Tax=Wyeomyia smithii TaxID=174621 RepID=UPI002467EFD1|nr:uncharacterized protein LOC129728654 [Wyeomyia smithii]